MSSFIYAEFANGTKYALNDARIELIPNQRVMFMGYQQPAGQKCATGAPLKYGKDVLIDTSYTYILTFRNNVPSEFFQEPFYVGKIKFFLESFQGSDWLVVAKGYTK